MEECPLKAFHHCCWFVCFFVLGECILERRKFLIFGVHMKLVPQSSSTITAVSLACGPCPWGGVSPEGSHPGKCAAVSWRRFHDPENATSVLIYEPSWDRPLLFGATAFTNEKWSFYQPVLGGCTLLSVKNDTSPTLSMMGTAVHIPAVRMLRCSI